MPELKINISEELEKAMEAKYELPQEIKLIEFEDGLIFPPMIEANYGGEVILLDCLNFKAEFKAMYKGTAFSNVGENIYLWGFYMKDGEIGSFLDSNRFLDLSEPI